MQEYFSCNNGTVILSVYFIWKYHFCIVFAKIKIKRYLNKYFYDKMSVI